MTKSMCICLLAVFGVICLSATLNAQTGVSGYHLVKQVKLGGEGGWDYLTVDPAAHRLYISRSTHVMVVDSDSGAILGDIPDTAGVHGIAIVPELGKGYTSNGRSATVTVFDLKTLKALKQVPVGQNPDAIMYDPASRRVFTFNGGSKDATAIDTKTDTVAGTVILNGRPEFAVADEKGHVFVNIEDKSLVAEFDAQKLTVLAQWPLAPCEEPTGLALDRKNQRLFAGCANKLMAVMSAQDGKIIATVPIGSGVDATRFDAETGLAFSSNGEGTVTVVREDSAAKFHVVESVATLRGARTMTLDEKTHKLYFVSAEFGPTPEATADRPRPRPSVLPGTFTLLIFSK